MTTSEVSSSVLPCNKPTMVDNPLTASDTTPTVTPISLSSSRFKIYECRNCPRVFPTPRALGGHQTAHRKPKDERLNHLKRQAEIPTPINAADNDVVLSPFPIRWLPPSVDNDAIPYKGYNFVPGSSDHVVNKKKKNQKKRNLSEFSEVISNQNKQKKKKLSAKLDEGSENNKGATYLRDLLEKKGSEESGKLSEECSGKKAGTLSDNNSENKQGSEATTKLTEEFSEIKASDTENNRINEEQRKKMYKKLMPSLVLTLATGAAPDVWVEVSPTDSSDGSKCILYF